MIHQRRRENLGKIKEMDKASEHGIIYTGMHWIPVKAAGGDNYPYNNLVCSACGYKTKMVPSEWNYCPHCGRLDEGR